MDTLSKSEIEAALTARLPSYNVVCTLHADGSLSAILSGPDADHFAVTGIVRAHYRGAEAIARLAHEILKEMVISRQGIRGTRLQTLANNQPPACPPGIDQGRTS
ncbi:hypothetical protein FQ186_25155 [Pseudomonas sp. ANT_H14]|uniref:hypothetical protein n=1 Tax=unclassified Pseudomonas TaxID=196821 RepID=UPI0011F0836D|nr:MULTISPECIES: hypothetical protein [unclassified Pseudomonas]KAA0942326.1 hypothetical protein FQ182_27720 [Pseudomonas sp. ANT_H4]KAA0947592.1 hypothetical protein FQ186_25155 [Pseudomonas sp. ANT_H14]